MTNSSHKLKCRLSNADEHPNVNMPTPHNAHKPHFSSCTRFLLLHSQQYMLDKTLAICFQPTGIQVFAQTFWAFCDWCSAIALRTATAVRQCSERKIVECPYLTDTLRTSVTHQLCGYRRHRLFTLAFTCFACCVQGTKSYVIGVHTYRCLDDGTAAFLADDAATRGRSLTDNERNTRHHKAKAVTPHWEC